MGFLLTNDLMQNITQVPNIFIDEYMPHANGSFVKVYLYLLRHAGSDPAALSVEDMADMLSNTETDILRALKYWEKQGLLSITGTEDRIEKICLLSFSRETNAIFSETAATADSREAIPFPMSGTEPSDSPSLPERHTYSPLQAEALKKDSEIESCLSMVEALLGTTLGDSHMQLILYLMSDLGFSMELVITLYETALSRGKSKPRYIEAIALDWAKKGIHTSKEAEEETASFHGIYKLVSNALGIHRALAPAERRIIDKWKDFQFPDVVIEEACSRTVLQSGDTNLNYTTKILEDWHGKGVTSLKDIEDCDRSYFRQKNVTRNRITPINKNKFQNFPQRDYSKSESADLERQLLQQ